MNFLMGNYHVFLFVQRLIEKRTNKKANLETKGLNKQNKAA